MKKLLALVLAMACALSLGIPTLAKTADVTWSQVNVEDFVDEDGDKIADDDVIRPGQTIYWVFGAYSDYDYLLDDKMVKIDVDKDEGSKNIDGKPKVVGKKLGNLGRCVALEIVIKDTYTADELKTKLDIYITAKKDLYATNAGSGKFPIYDEQVRTGADQTEITRLEGEVTTKQGAVNTLTNRKNELVAKNLPSLATIESYENAFDAWTATNNIGGKDVTYEGLEAAVNAASGDVSTHADRLAALNQTDAAPGIAYYEAQKEAQTAAKEILVAGATNVPADGKTYTIRVTYAGDGKANAVTAWGAEDTANPGTWVAVNTITGLDTAISTTLTDAANAYNATIDVLDGVNIDALKSDKAGYEAEITLATALSNEFNNPGTGYAIAKENRQAAIDAGYSDKSALATPKAEAQELATINSTDATVDGSLAKANKELKDAQDALAAAKAGNQVGTGYLKKGDTMKVPMTIWIQNENRVDDDATFVAGEKGVVIKPVKNEENTVTWEDNNDTLAIMKFTADSDVEYYMPRMATKWNNEDYLDYFDDMDAYIRSFVGNPSIPCTSRARLWINNPFVDDDGEETIDPDDIYVYEVVDGELYDITDKVEYTTNDDDDYAFLIKTRTLGTYIFSDGPADIEDEDDDDYDPEAPDKVEVNNNKKPVPPTGF